MSFQPQVRVRRRWVWWTLGVIVVLALLAGLVTWVQGLQDDTGPPPGAQPSPTATGGEGRVANGCLGGPTVDAQMVLTAQEEAPLDDTGAAEFAAAFERWIGLLPAPPTEDVETVLSAVTAPDASDAVRDMPAAFDDFRESADQERWFSTEDGRYYVEASSANEVVVSVLLMVEDGSPTAPDENPQGSSNTYTLDRSTGAWLLKDIGGTRAVADLYEIGLPFSGGC